MDPRPAATLIFPWFEVELGTATGVTTLIAIGNSAPSAPQLAHVIVWTDRGVPTLDFDLYLEPNDVQTINLRDLFLSGSLPATGGPGFPGCAQPISLPPLGEAERALLRAQHTGQPAGPGGRCWASSAGGSRALGFVTVDAASQCSATIRLPSQAGYYVHGGAGIASNSNRLFGDWFLVDVEQGSASGSPAVHLVADVDRFRWHSNRSLLPFSQRTRFLNGGDFEGGADLLVFRKREAWNAGVPVPCGTDFGRREEAVWVQPLDENGVASPWFYIDARDLDGRVSARFSVGDGPLDADPAFGQFQVENHSGPYAPYPLPPLRRDSGELHVESILSAAGRYSVGLGAVAVDGHTLACPSF